MARAKMAVGEIGTITAKQVAGNEPGKPAEAVKWQATARYGLMNGETERIRRTATTKGKAEKAIRDEVARRRASGGTVTHSARAQTVIVIMDAWLSSIKALPPTVDAGGEAVFTKKGAVAPQTFEQYVRHATLVKNGLGGIEASTLTTGQCEAFLHGLADEEAGTGFNTARLTRVVLAQAMTYAVRMGLRRENPVMLVSALPKKVIVPVAPDGAAITVMRRLISNYTDGLGRSGPRPNRRVSDVFELLLATGARIGEVMALRWEDVDLDIGSVTICGTLIERGALYRQPFPKTSKGHRTLLLTGWVHELLGELQKRRVPGAVSDGVFTTRSGRFASMSGVRRSLRGALEFTENDLVGVHPHAFRKTVATLLADGLGENAAMQQLGHSSPEVTRRAYIQRADRVPDYRPVLEALAPAR